MKKIISILFLFFFFSTLGFGCKGLSTQEQQAIRPVTLNYWTVYDDYPTLKKFATDYNALRSYVTVNVRQIRYDELHERLLNALADDVAPDIVSIPVNLLPQYQKWLSAMPSSVQVANVYVKGQYSPETVVEQLTQSMPTIQEIKNSYVGTVYNDVVIGGKVYGLPLSLDTLALYYNKDLLDLAGVPSPPTTWDEFLDAVKKTTRYDSSGNIVQSGVAMGTSTNVRNSQDIFAMLLMQNKVDVVKNGVVHFADNMEKADETHPTFQALRFYTDFANPLKEVYSWNATMDDSLDAFLREKSVFYFGFARDFAQIGSRAKRLNIEILPVPQLNPSVPANVASYWVESVTDKSKKKNVAWDFIRFMAKEKGVREYVTATKLPSPLRAHIKLFETDPVMEPFESQVLFAKSWYQGKDIETANKAIGNLIDTYRTPVQEGEVGITRDRKITSYAARIVQQTL